MEYTMQDIDTIENWWVQKSRKNFLAYRMFMRHGNFKNSWFITDISRQLQNFYLEYIAGMRPVLMIQAPPQHGKSWSAADFIAWIIGKINSIRVIYASYSDTLGIRCNTHVQRSMDSRKYNLIFPDSKLPSARKTVTQADKAKRTDKHLEFLDSTGKATDGQFRNTTVNGRVNGESLDIGVIDDAVKGRAEANSITQSQKIWDWFTDDFHSRFSDLAGLLIIMTRWTTHDIIARLKESGMDNIKIINYKAIATQDEEHRKEGEPLFPEQKSLDFINNRKKVMHSANFEAQYQGEPTVVGGNMVKDTWWKWWKVQPRLEYKFITCDTAQKTKTKNDWTCFQCWGVGIDGNLYLLDKFREKLEAPDLRREAEFFYRRHDTPRLQVGDPILRGIHIEDKSSGIGLIQELRRKKLKIKEIPRNAGDDKVFRMQDVSPYIEAGNVYLNTDIDGVDNLTKEGREFPNSEFDDDIDCLMTAVEIAYIDKSITGDLSAAMKVDD